jgi:hypothetical protein
MPHGFGVSKGAASLLLIGAFLAMRALREEKALISYGFLKKAIWASSYILNPLLFFMVGPCSCCSDC